MAQENEKSEKFPNISGEALLQFSADRITSSQKRGVPSTNSFIYAQSDMALNLNQNWALKTQWRLQPNDTYTTRNRIYPERFRTILSQNRNTDFRDNGLLVEELQIDFHNEDMVINAGKFDPKFGNAHSRTKKMGIFTSQFTEDYNLREKIGAGLTVFLEDSELSISSFFNDTTGLSRSAFDSRSRAKKTDNIAGNTGTLSSYKIALDGGNLMGKENWFYSIAYRSLGVDKTPDRRRETGLVLSSEYLYELGLQTSLIPFVELVKINNFTGATGRDAFYSTIALILKYSAWNISASSLTRDIHSTAFISRVKDKQLQVSVGYNFNDNFSIDFTRAQIKEDGYQAGVFGVNLSYLLKF